MHRQALEIIRGSTNVFRDFDEPEILHMKATLARKIIRVLDERNLTVRGASALTSFAAADFSRVRRAKVQGFSLDRLVGMLGRLGQDVELRVRRRIAAVDDSVQAGSRG